MHWQPILILATAIHTENLISNIKTLIVATNPAEKNEMENLNQYLESKNHELWTDNESRHDAFWPLAMTSIVGVGTLRQNPQLASIFRSKKGGSAIDNKQLWPIWMTEACDKEAANMQAIFTSSQTWTLSNNVKSVNSANSESKQIIVRCYLHLWRNFFTLSLASDIKARPLSDVDHSPVVVHHLLDVVIKATTSLLHIVSHLRHTWWEGKQILVTSIARCKIWWEHCARGKFHIWYSIDIFSRNFRPKPMMTHL